MPDSLPRLGGAPLARLDALLARLDRRIGGLRARSLAFSRVRLGVALGGLALALVLGGTLGPAWGWGTALVLFVGFRALARRHERTERALARTLRWRAVQAGHAARLRLDWDGLGPAPAPAPAGHPFAADLDVVGPRSLLHLLDTAATEAGHARLRSWLLAPAPSPDAARRQALVRALAPRRRFRDRLALLGREAAEDGAPPPRRGEAPRPLRWDDAAVRAWAEAPPPDPALGRWAWGLSVLAALTAAGLVAWFLGLAPPLWRLSFFAYVGLYLWRFRAWAGAFDQAYDLQQALVQAAPALGLLEQDPAGRDPALAPLFEAFHVERAPSRHLGRLGRLVEAAALSRNAFGRVLFNALLPYDLLLTRSLEGLRVRLGAVLPGWLDGWAEVEAAGALAAWADVHADEATFPELLPDEGPSPLFEAQFLAHPLLGPGAVANSITLDSGEVVVVTGSNMSGKSTFLRAAGLATVLAWAGGAVPARGLRLRPLRVFTSMRVGDAVQEGLSTFYAEVRRLRALLDSLAEPGQPPTLVLLDEMLRGTNNRERLAGGLALTRALAGARAASLVATHDLGLADLAETDPRLCNAHFREEAEGDHLAFDYRLRPGPCPTTNALVIMRRAGLPV